MRENIFKDSGIKNTQNRQLILKILEDSHKPVTAEEIFIQARQQHELNFSTVYRTLATLTEKNIILKNIQMDGKACYQMNNHSHNHYLVCSECQKRVPIENCPLEEMGESLVKQTGFHITGHNLEFIGECPDCIKKKQ